MEKLQKVFDGCRKHKIYINLNSSCLFSPCKDEVDPEINYVGFIYSISDEEEVLESISDEGSSIISYRVTGLQNNGKKIRDLFCAMLITYNFRPFLNEKTYYNSENEIYEYNVDILITDKEFPNLIIKVDESDDFDEYFEEEMEGEEDMEKYEEEIEEEPSDGGSDEKEEESDEKEEESDEKEEGSDEKEEESDEKEEESDEKEEEIDEKEEESDTKEEESDTKEKESNEKDEIIDEEKKIIDEKEEIIDEEKEKKTDEKEEVGEEKKSSLPVKNKRGYKKTCKEELSTEENEYAELKKTDLLVLCENLKITKWAERTVKSLNKGDLIKAIVSHKLSTTK